MYAPSFQAFLEGLLQQFGTETAGAVADYIPQLGKVDPSLFGIAVVTVDGHVYQAGDSRTDFSIQSVSKAFTYGVALEDAGETLVNQRIDVEPSGEAFNSISLEEGTGRPKNPMINAGAIVATSLVNGDTGEDKIQRILSKMADYTGHPMRIDQSVYESERDTGHRNRAIAHLLRNYEILEGDPEQPLDAYFQQCSVLINARDLALMASCLANDGVNPITGVRALKSEYVPRVLSVMSSCGMYDYSGNWIHQVGMPAKSGVGGGIVAVLPGQLGLAVFSPRLDAKGNSVRGIKVCQALSDRLGLHLFRVTRTTTISVIRTRYSAKDVRSKLQRSVQCLECLKLHGDRVQVLELTGELMFVSAEIVASEATREMRDRDFLILDFSHVAGVDHSACKLLGELIDDLLEKGKQVFVTGAQRHQRFTGYLKKHFKAFVYESLLKYNDLDLALEEAEDRLMILTQCAGETTPVNASLAQQLLCQGLNEAELSTLQELVDEESYAEGDLICAEGSAADRMFFILSGRIEVSIALGPNRIKRLSASSSGNSFGESALYEAGLRSADIRAISAVKLLSLAPEKLKKDSSQTAINLQLKLLANLTRTSMQRLAQANKEIRILTG